MMSGKRLYIILLCMIFVIQSCRVHTFPFVMYDDYDQLLSKVPPFTQEGCNAPQASISRIIGADFYRAGFKEALVEHDNVIEWAQVSEKFASQLPTDTAIMPNHQDLYLIRLHAKKAVCKQDGKKDVWTEGADTLHNYWMFCSVKFIPDQNTSDSSYLCAGFGPSYIGHVEFNSTIKKFYFYSTAEVKIWNRKGKMNMEKLGKPTEVSFTFDKFMDHKKEIGMVTVNSKNKFAGIDPYFVLIDDSMKQYTPLEFVREK